jgi:prevent-host-death family protein
MTTTITIEEAQKSLAELLDRLTPGQEVVITRNQQPIAKLVSHMPSHAPRPAPGLGKGEILYMSPDFDAPLEEFREYVE